MTRQRPKGFLQMAARGLGFMAVVAGAFEGTVMYQQQVQGRAIGRIRCSHAPLAALHGWKKFTRRSDSPAVRVILERGSESRRRDCRLDKDCPREIAPPPTPAPPGQAPKV